MISPWSIRSHAIGAAAAAHWANLMARGLCVEDTPSEHAYCAEQLASAAKRLATEAEAISAKIAAGEGSVLETTERAE